MIERISVKNFKAFEKESFVIFDHNLIIGENDAGKSTLLQALDIFFNQEKIEKIYIRDISKPVEIGVLINKKYYKKTFTPSAFKCTEHFGDFTEIEHLKYIYIPVGQYDPKQIITQLATAKAISNTNPELLEQFKEIAQQSINDVISSINEDIIVVNNGSTSLDGKEQFKYEAALKFAVENNGISIDARGSGYQKNLTYGLFVGSEYHNVILGIDEIENSFSINNSKSIIIELQNKIGQTLFTTHSKRILESRNNAEIIPLFSNNNKTIAELLTSLDENNDKIFLIVEGKYDLPWFKKALNLLEIQNNYILVPGGGEANASILKVQLENSGKNCIIIKDGDTGDTNSIQKDCIELYTPLDNINSIFELQLSEVPDNKDDFFAAIVSTERNISKDTVKSMLANEVDNFLTMENTLIGEIKDLLNI